MAEKNLTGALLELKDKERLRAKQGPRKTKNPSPSRKNALPYRTRSFDSFYSFICILLGAVVVAQFAAIIIYS